MKNLIAEVINFRKMVFFVSGMTVFISCDLNSSSREMTGPDRFTWNVQHGGYDYFQYDQMGETDYQNFLKEFESFPWIEEIKEANKYTDRCSPTITVTDEMAQTKFWISMSGDSSSYKYIVGYIYLNSGGKRWNEMYLTESHSTIKDLINLYFNRDYDEFEVRLKELEYAGGMESHEFGV